MPPATPAAPLCPLCPATRHDVVYIRRASVHRLVGEPVQVSAPAVDLVSVAQVRDGCSTLISSTLRSCARATAKRGSRLAPRLHMTVAWQPHNERKKRCVLDSASWFSPRRSSRPLHSHRTTSPPAAGTGSSYGTAPKRRFPSTCAKTTVSGEAGSNSMEPPRPSMACASLAIACTSSSHARAFSTARSPAVRSPAPSRPPTRRAPTRRAPLHCRERNRRSRLETRSRQAARSRGKQVDDMPTRLVALAILVGTLRGSREHSTDRVDARGDVHRPAALWVQLGQHDRSHRVRTDLWTAGS